MDYFVIPSQYVVVGTEKESEYSHDCLYWNVRIRDMSADDWSTTCAYLHVNLVVCRHSVPRVQVEDGEHGDQF